MNIQKLQDNLESPRRFATSYIQDKTCKLVNAQTELSSHITRSKKIEEGDDFLCVFSDKGRASWVTVKDYSEDAGHLVHQACMHKNSSITQIEERARLLRNAGINS